MKQINLDFISALGRLTAYFWSRIQTEMAFILFYRTYLYFDPTNTWLERDIPTQALSQKTYTISIIASVTPKSLNIQVVHP